MAERTSTLWFLHVHTYITSLVLAGTAYPSGAPEFTPVFSGVRVTRSLVLYVCFVDRCLYFCTFSFGHCAVCSSSIYGFWLPLWYCQTLLERTSTLWFIHVHTYITKTELKYQTINHEKKIPCYLYKVKSKSNMISFRCWGVIGIKLILAKHH